MLELAKQIQEHIKNKVRDMASHTLADIRKLEFVHDSSSQRSYLSGKLAAYEEIIRLIMERE